MAAGYDRYEITGTTQLNGKIYYQFDHKRIYITGNCSVTMRLFQYDKPIRIDSLSLNIYRSSNAALHMKRWLTA